MISASAAAAATRGALILHAIQVRSFGAENSFSANCVNGECETNAIQKMMR